MFEIQNYASFIAAIVVFQLIPGPGTLAILNAASTTIEPEPGRQNRR